MTDVPDDAYRIQAEAERWQTLVVRQHDLVLQLRQIVNEQRELADLWAEADSAEIVAEARAIERELHRLWARLLRLEQDAVDKIAGAVADAARELRPD